MLGVAAIDDGARAVANRVLDQPFDAGPALRRDDRSHLHAVVQAVAGHAGLGARGGSPRRTDSDASPTVMATEEARQRWPAQPKALSATMSAVMSMSASGMTTTGFLAPPWHCTRLPAAAAARVDVARGGARADEARWRGSTG